MVVLALKEVSFDDVEQINRKALHLCFLATDQGEKVVVCDDRWNRGCEARCRDHERFGNAGGDRGKIC